MNQRVNTTTALSFIACNDFGGITRGRGFPRNELASYLETGIGWVPANQAITPFDSLGKNPFDAFGDLRIMPDPNAEFSVKGITDSGDLQFLLGNICTLDGQPWQCCPRSFLIQSIRQLEAATGLSAKIAFEHEFVLQGEAFNEVTQGFSLQRFAQTDGFAGKLIKTLQEAGVDPEMFLPEFGQSQFEITMKPGDALNTADRAIALREITKMVATHFDARACFAPKMSQESMGNGVHVHLSLQDANGQAVMYDEKGVGQLSAVANQFAAGVIRHAGALTALSAPSLASYYRLQPNHWSNAFAFLGMQNREAMLRICPAPTPKHDPQQTHHLEFRTPDATASPYMVVGALICAGLSGIQEELDPPPLMDCDLGKMSEAARKAQGIQRLPESLEQALKALKNDKVASSWFSEQCLETYLAMKNQEISHGEGKNENEIHQLYRSVY